MFTKKNLFKKIFENAILFKNNKTKNYNLVLEVNKTDNQYIVTYLEGKINKKEIIDENNIKNYSFLQKTNNYFYKKYKPVSITEIIKEMDTSAAGVGGASDSQFSSDFYAKGDARNLFGKNSKPPIIKRPQIKDTFMKTEKKKKKKGEKEQKNN